MVDYFSNSWGLDNILYFQSWYPVEGCGRKYAGSDIVDIVVMDDMCHRAPLLPPRHRDFLHFARTRVVGD
jgi:hypothetical protein